MTETVINLNIDDSNNIIISNESNGNTYMIDYANKEINATKIYELLSYNENVQYNTKSNVEILDDGNVKDYFNEIILIIKKITDELNALNSEDDDDNRSDENEVDSENVTNFDDLPF